MATCPNCGAKSREDPGALVIQEIIVPKPLGTFSLSGSTLKFSANRRLQLRCQRCDWAILGHLDGDSFVADASPEA
jgi:hypothetical protein